MSEKGESVSSQCENDDSERYDIIATETSQKNLERLFDKKSCEKIKNKIQEMLRVRPYHYERLSGQKIRGVITHGLRRMKVGVSGRRGGAVVLYMICEECRRAGHFRGNPCSFCDNNKNKHIVILDIFPRNIGYK